jgi:hypothetical protein
MMLRLVAFRSVDPNTAGTVDVDGSHRTNLTGPHSREALELDHRPYPPGDVRLNRVNEGVGDRTNWLGLPNVGTAAAETAHGA